MALTEEELCCSITDGKCFLGDAAHKYSIAATYGNEDKAIKLAVTIKRLESLLAAMKCYYDDNFGNNSLHLNCDGDEPNVRPTFEICLTEQDIKTMMSKVSIYCKC